MRQKAMILALLVLFVIGVVPAHATDPGSYSTYNQALFLDVDWYHENLITTADLWNGGLDGESGMGVYRDDFDGFFHVQLDQQWRQERLEASTSIAQSRAIYMNVEAYRAAGPDEGERFLEAVNRGVEFLLTKFYDETYGGFYWAVNANGLRIDRMKQGYGNVHPIFALAQAYSITQNPNHLAAALEQLDTFTTYFLDPDYACAIAPGFSRDFSEVIGVNNVDVFTHFFEALLSLHDVTTGDTQAEIDGWVNQCGDFLVGTLYHDQEGFTDRGYVAYNYDEVWQPAQAPYSRDTQWSGARHATTGHNIELAYLLSRAIERGFNPEWMTTAEKLLMFCEIHAIDSTTSGMLYEITDYDGQPLEGNPDNPFYIWWAQAETARALLHFLIVRGEDRYAEMFKNVEYLFNALLTDPTYGGLYDSLDSRDDLAPVGFGKANIWKVNYHYSMFFAEVLRLQAIYPERIAEFNQVPA